jgi:hypothetical protein
MPKRVTPPQAKKRKALKDLIPGKPAKKPLKKVPKRNRQRMPGSGLPRG